MNRYIDADELIRFYEPYADMKVPVNALLEQIKDTSTTDVEPVRHGRWLDKTQEPGWPVAECSVCGSHSGMFWMRRCPNCGAKMDEKEGN